MSFLADQITTYKRQLEESEEAFDNYRLEYALFSPEEQRKLLLAQRVGLDGQLKGLDNQAVEMQKRLTKTEQDAFQSKRAALQQQLRQMDEVLRALNTHEKKLRNLQREMVTSEEMYRTYSRKLEEIRISEALDPQKLTNMSVLMERALGSSEEQRSLVLSPKAGTDGQLKRLDNPAADMQKRLTKTGQDAIQNKRDGIQEQLRKMDEAMRTSSGHEKKLRDLLREMTTSEDMYRTYARRLEEARISEEMDAQRLSNISILQAATAPASPSGVPLRIKLGVAAVMGVMAGMAAALLADFALGKRRGRA